jgi:hypothetical protein
MDIVYTDENMIDDGILQGFELDLDVASGMDFEIKVNTSNNVLRGGCWWYVNDTEYGGVVDIVKVSTSDREITYSGRSFRGILSSKIVEPPNGEDYRVLSGNVGTVVSELLTLTRLNNLFDVESCNVTLGSYQVARYADLYSTLLAIGDQIGLVLRLNVTDCKVTLSYVPAIDYSDETEYRQDDVNFTITREYNGVNHLVCLGKGELKDRTVVHLFVDDKGNIVDNQYYVGVLEYAQTYEYTSAENEEVLNKEGRKKLQELMAQDTFSVTAENSGRHIGDIIGGYEATTGMYVTSSITNMIVKVSDNSEDISYSVGEATRKG